MGVVASIFIAAEPEAPMRPVDEVEAVEGVGLQGDRYSVREGRYRKHVGDASRDVTLFEQEAVEAVQRDYSIDLEPHDMRRNVMTTGVALNHLVGREFTVGDVRLRGVKLCEPCAHLEQLAGKPVRTPLKHRGGLRAQIVEGGTIRVGDQVQLASPRDVQLT